MSLDPAISEYGDMIGFKKLSDFEIAATSIYVFDFDGVLCSRIEDDIYKLPPQAEELDLLTRAARVFGIRCEKMDLRYQRHLLYQAAAWRLGLPIEEGAGLPFAARASAQGGMFILTARSGWYAVERFRSFLLKHSIVPIETYHVGRVHKDKQLMLLCREFSSSRVVYVEDSLPHLQAAQELCLPNLEFAWSHDESRSHNTEDLRAHYIGIVEDALARWVGES